MLTYLAGSVPAGTFIAYPDEAEALDTCAALVPELVRGLAAALRRVPAGADDKACTEVLGAVRAVESALTSARAEVGARDEHFDHREAVVALLVAVVVGAA